MKKLIISFLIFSHSSFLMAGKGMIVVLEAPFFREQSWDSVVVQNARKGDIVFIHDKHMGLSTYHVDYGVGNRDTANSKNKGHKGFYQTLDKNGVTAFIPRKYVKLIYRDTREFQTSITPFKKDPTDYRLEEPLPKSYPLYPVDKWRASINLTFGPGSKNNYTYPQAARNETFSSRKGFEIVFTRKVEFDPYDRFYFGGIFHLYGEDAQFSLADQTEANESKGQLGIGPFTSYDVYRSKKNIFTIGGGITLNYNRFLVRQSLGEFAEERLFSGFSITPKFTAFYQIKDILKKGLNFIFGTEMQLHLNHSLSSSTQPNISSFWNDDLANDRFNIPLGGQYSIFLGIQTTTE